MNIRIVETGEEVVLQIFDKNGVEYSQDLIGNADNISHNPVNVNNGFIIWNEEEEEYYALASTVEWWQNYIDGENQTEEEIMDLVSLGMDEDQIRRKVEKYTGWDYETHRQNAVEALRELKQEYYVYDESVLGNFGFVGKLEDFQKIVNELASRVDSNWRGEVVYKTVRTTDGKHFHDCLEYVPAEGESALIATRLDHYLEEYDND